jgi:hypothetical protein
MRSNDEQHYVPGSQEIFPMLKRNIEWVAIALLVLITQCSGGVQANLNSGGPSLLCTPGDEQTIVRIFYNPSPGDYFHFPLVLRVVRAGDPRLKMASVLLEGQTVYITGEEMQNLLQRLDRAGLSWQISEKVEALGSFHHLLIGDVEFRVVSPKGTAVANLDPKKLCATLQPLDAALKTPRALWEFQLFRVQDGCKVPGFNSQQYPDHW